MNALEATLQIAQALGGETDLEVVLELVAKRGRALVSARAVVIEHERESDMVIVAVAGELPQNLVGQCVDLRNSLAGTAIRTRRVLRLEDEPNRARFQRHGLGRLGVSASGGLVVPLVFRGKSHGVLIAVDRVRDGPAFSHDDQRLLEAFAASAAAALATAESFEADRRRQKLAAVEQERARWARDLHDETLQNLTALQVGIALQLELGDPEGIAQAAGEAVAQLETEIGNIRSLVTELRPVALDHLGVEAAIEELAEKSRNRGLEISLTIDLAYEQQRQPDRHSIELETAIYRIIQEALTNATKHGGARHAVVEIAETQTDVRVTVQDDGHGFDTTAPARGLGITGMRERAELLGGRLAVESAHARGTIVKAILPVTRRGAPQRLRRDTIERAG